MAQKLDKSILQDLHKGCACISLLEIADPKAFTYSGADFSQGHKIYTVKDSFNISEDEPTQEELKIDQMDEVIDISVEGGKTTITGNIPSFALQLYEFFYNKAKDVKALVGGTGAKYDGASFFNEPKEVICPICIESASKQSAIAFSRVSLTVTKAYDDNKKPLYLKLKGTVLGNLNEKEGAFSILKKAL